MEQFEKVEKIAQKAGVSFEEAKAALEASNWDMLDAMLALEREGKKGSAQTTFSTDYESQPGYKKVEVNAQNYKRSNRNSAKSFGEKLKSLLKKSHVNHFVVTRGEKELVSVPIWFAVLVTLWMWKPVLLMLIIAFIAGCHVSFDGPDEDEMSAVNNASETAGKTVSSVARDIKESFQKGYNSEMNKPAQSQQFTYSAEQSQQSPYAAAQSQQPASAATQPQQPAYTAQAQESPYTAAAEPEKNAEAESAPVQSGAEFEANDFRGFTDGFASQNSDATGTEDILRTASAVFSDNSVTTDDGKITLEL